MLQGILAKPTHCTNCGYDLANIRHECRDTILQKTFCSRSCLEHYRLAKVVESSRHVH